MTPSVGPYINAFKEDLIPKFSKVVPRFLVYDPYWYNIILSRDQTAAIMRLLFISLQGKLKRPLQDTTYDTTVYFVSAAPDKQCNNSLPLQSIFPAGT